jgi:hypothetical protein
MKMERKGSQKDEAAFRLAASIFNWRVLNTKSYMGSILSKTSQQMFKNDPGRSSNQIRPLVKYRHAG